MRISDWSSDVCSSDLAVNDSRQLQRSLAQLALPQVGLNPRQLATLQAMGLRRLGEVFALPRPELARRLGPDLLDWLDRLRGQSVEPCPPYRPPTQFFQRNAFD